MKSRSFLDDIAGSASRHFQLFNASRGTLLAQSVEPAFDSKARRTGLLGRTSIAENYALIIAPCESIHTFFMRCPIDAVFVARDGTVLKTCRSLRPWRLAGSWRAFAVVEGGVGLIDRSQTTTGDVIVVRSGAESAGGGVGMLTGARAGSPDSTSS